MDHPVTVLEKFFNYTSFRPLQEDIINHVLKGEDSLVLMPTGGGKSLCFQIPALVKPGICIVISPLVALMKDQVDALNDKGIKAMALTSGLSFDDLSIKLDNCIYGNYKFLYLSPERLQQDMVQERLKKMNVNLIAVDEAHCISQWGNDFRPSYKNITFLRTLLPTVNIIALTASATQEVVEDIVKELDFIGPKVFKTSFVRNNLAYMVFKIEDKLFRLKTILVKNKQSSIVYVRNRRSTVEISDYLNQQGISSTFYHGGLDASKKTEHYDLWMQDKVQVMVATNAFGMGIDKSNVKTVIHLNLPDSLESYFQEAGRAGRNDNKAFAVILCNTNDENLLKKQFLSVLPTVENVKTVYKKINSFFQVAYGEKPENAYDFDFAHFCDHYNINYTVTYNALQIMDRTSIISLSKQFNKNNYVQFVVSNQHLFNYLDTHKSISLITKAILRTYGGIFDHVTNINLSLISNKVSLAVSKIDKALLQLEKDEIITLQQTKTDASLVFLVPREDDQTINTIAKLIKQQNKVKLNQVNAVINYIDNDQICKSKQLVSYFGESKNENCGICSVCIKNNINKVEESDMTASKILNYLEHEAADSRSISLNLKLPEEIVLKVLKKLLEHKHITITKSNTYKLLK
jgi:ATP-dependent DNA helicase RecQ